MTSESPSDRYPLLKPYGPSPPPFSNFITFSEPPLTLLQHGVQAFAKDTFDLDDPPVRLALDHFVVVVLELADVRQHLWQRRQPFLAKLLGELLLALDGRQTDRRLLRPQVAEDRAVELLLVLLGVCRRSQLDNGGDQLVRQVDGRGVEELRGEHRRDLAEMRGCLPEIVLVVLEAPCQSRQNAPPQLLLLRQLEVARLDDLDGVVHNVGCVVGDDRFEALEEHLQKPVDAEAAQRASDDVLLGELRGPLDDVREDGPESRVVELVDHLEGDFLLLCVLASPEVQRVEENRRQGSYVLCDDGLGVTLDHNAKDVNPLTGQQCLGLDLPSKESQAVEALVVGLAVQVGLGGLVGREEDVVQVLRGDHVRQVLCQGGDERVSGIVQLVRGLLFLHALFDVENRLGNGNVDDRQNAILQDIDERGKAEQGHDAQAGVGLAEAVGSGDGRRGARHGLDVLLAVLLCNLVDAGNGGVLVLDVVRVPDRGCQLRQESEQRRPRGNVCDALLVHTNLEGPEDLAAEIDFGVVQEVEQVGQGIAAALVQRLLILDRLGEGQDIPEKNGVQVADLGRVHVVPLRKDGDLLPELPAGKERGEDSQLLQGSGLGLLLRQVLADAQQGGRKTGLGLEDVTDQVEELGQGLELHLGAVKAEEFRGKRHQAVVGAVSIDQHRQQGEQELIGAQGVDESNEQALLAVRGDVLVRGDEAGEQLGGAGDRVSLAFLERRHQGRDDLLDGLVHHMRRVVVVLAENGGAHESENGHDAMKHEIRGGRGEAGNQKQGRVLHNRARRLLDAVDEQVAVASRAVNLQALVVPIGGDHRDQARQHQVLQVAKLGSDDGAEVLQLREGAEQTVQEFRVGSRVGTIHQLEHKRDRSQRRTQLGTGLRGNCAVRLGRAGPASLVCRRLGDELRAGLDGLEEVGEDLRGELDVPQEIGSLIGNDVLLVLGCVPRLGELQHCLSHVELGIGLHRTPDGADARRDGPDQRRTLGGGRVLDDREEAIQPLAVVGHNDLGKSGVKHSLVHLLDLGETEAHHWNAGSSTFVLEVDDTPLMRLRTERRLDLTRSSGVATTWLAKNDKTDDLPAELSAFFPSPPSFLALLSRVECSTARMWSSCMMHSSRAGRITPCRRREAVSASSHCTLALSSYRFLPPQTDFFAAFD
ncbi:hypothetical protein CTA1_7996 [Colletotrichum tanaceti]|uniref:Uncharacterized protein n=1 Tax=Colletotrichum tanaceti TaxID=1306861 RepID=A0A4U6XMP5_9PEZI|nr:hypothetical protein CTA1_7996 [Colletotrichum tanaceti]